VFVSDCGRAAFLCAACLMRYTPRSTLSPPISRCTRCAPETRTPSHTRGQDRVKIRPWLRSDTLVEIHGTPKHPQTSPLDTPPCALTPVRAPAGRHRGRRLPHRRRHRRRQGLCPPSQPCISCALWSSALNTSFSQAAHATSVADMAFAMLRAVRRINAPNSKQPLAIRVGIHSGPVMTGVPPPPLALPPPRLSPQQGRAWQACSGLRCPSSASLATRSAPTPGIALPSARRCTRASCNGRGPPHFRGAAAPRRASLDGLTVRIAPPAVSFAVSFLVVNRVFSPQVNTASRMESGGEPGRIQVTPATAELLRVEGYAVESRGIMQVQPTHGAAPAGARAASGRPLRAVWCRKPGPGPAASRHAARGRSQRSTAFNRAFNRFTPRRSMRWARPRRSRGRGLCRRSG